MYSIITKINENPLLNEVIISNEKINFKSIIYPNLGASIQKLKHNEIDIIDGISNNQAGLDLYKSKYNSSWLFPFPNRIQNGKYSFENNDYELEINETNLNNRLHGHIFNKSFSIKN
jgi:aldose 1-epimerase